MNDGQDSFNVGASRDLRDDALELLVKFVLRGDHGAKNVEVVIDDGCGCFVAGRFDDEDVHGIVKTCSGRREGEAPSEPRSTLPRTRFYLVGSTLSSRWSVLAALLNLRLDMLDGTRELSVDKNGAARLIAAG